MIWTVIQLCRDKLIEYKQYITQYGEDMPEVRDWKSPYWSAGLSRCHVNEVNAKSS